MDRRYAFLIAALICFAFTSLSSTSALRGIYAPLSGFFLLCVSAYYFIAFHVGSVSRPERFVPSPEEDEILRRQREKTLRK